MSARPLVSKGLTVPYVAAWSAELDADSAADTLTLRTSLPGGAVRLVYTDEQPIDRDRDGVLWHRVAWAQGQGRPLFAEIHTLRQRRTMTRGLCQVCADPAQVWMTSAAIWEEDRARYGPDAPYSTADPPVCRACAEAAAQQCPHLSRNGYVFLAPRTWAATAIRGQVADPVTGEFSPPRTVALPGSIPPSNPALLRLTLAKGLIATLFDPALIRDPHDAPGLGARRDRPAHSPSPATTAPRLRACPR